MELNQLYYFLEVARLSSVSRAAETLHISQPSLSNTIKRLEADLGVPLFERAGRGIRLSEYGLTAEKRVTEVFRQLEDLRREFADLKDGLCGSIRLGATYPVHEEHWFIQCVRDFYDAYPQISLQIKQMDPTEVYTLLQSRELDLALTTRPIESNRFVSRTLSTESIGVIMSVNHPLVEKWDLSLRDLAEYPFFCNNANSDVQDLTTHFCHLAGFDPHIVFEGDLKFFIGQAISRGPGVSFISETGYINSCLGETLGTWKDTIAFRTLRESYCQRTYSLVHLKNGYVSKAALRLGEYIATHYKARSLNFRLQEANYSDK